MSGRVSLFTTVLITQILISSAFAQTKYNFRLVEIHPQDYPIAVTDKEFAKIVEVRSKGRIKIESDGMIGLGLPFFKLMYITIQCVMLYHIITDNTDLL
jgi:TRAP-type mannitol/chloroaromatic compound transport system substrate-binding protein